MYAAYITYCKLIRILYTHNCEALCKILVNYFISTYFITPTYIFQEGILEQAELSVQFSESQGINLDPVYYHEDDKI